MAFNIPSNPIENYAQGLAATAVDPATAGAKAAGPYNIATAVAGGALKIFEEVKKAQKLDDEAVVMEVMAEADTKMRGIRVEQNEAPGMKNDSGEDVKAFSPVSLDNPAVTYGSQQFERDMKAWSDERFSSLTTSQRRMARSSFIELKQKHSNAIIEDQSSRRKEHIATTGIESVQTMVSDGNWKDATARNHQQFLNGAYGMETYQALRQYIANEEFRGVVTDFMQKPANDTTFAETMREIEEWKDPLITEDMRATAIGTVYTYQEKARVDQVRNLGLQQDANEIEFIAGIEKGLITSELITNAARNNVISRTAVGTLLTMLKDTSEGKTNPAVLTDLTLSVTRAQDLSQSAQLESKQGLKDQVYASYEAGDLSRSDFKDQLALANKLGSGDWATPGYKEAVARAGLFLGATPPPTNPDGSPNVDAMISQMLIGNQKIGAQMARMKMNLDIYLQNIPADEVSSAAMRWVNLNVATYAQQAPMVSDLTAAVRGYVSPHINAAGVLTKPKNDIFRELHSQARSGVITQAQLEERYAEMTKWFDARELAEQQAADAQRMAEESGAAAATTGGRRSAPAG